MRPDGRNGIGTKRLLAISVVFLAMALARCSSPKETGGNQGLSAVSVTPADGSGTNQTFSYVFSDPNGSADMTYALMMINATLSPASSCYMSVERSTSRLWLVSDSGSGNVAGSPITLGTAGTLQNSQCIVDGGASSSSSSSSGNNLTVNVALTFKPVFAGAKGNFMTVSDRKNQTTGWQKRGGWTVP